MLYQHKLTSTFDLLFDKEFLGLGESKVYNMGGWLVHEREA
jgi:hypothetical protein